METLRTILNHHDVFQLVIKKYGMLDLLWDFYCANNKSDELFARVIHCAVTNNDSTYLDWMYAKNPDIMSWDKPDIGSWIWEMIDRNSESSCSLWFKERTSLQDLLLKNISCCCYLSMRLIERAMSLGPHFELEKAILLNIVSNNKLWALRHFPKDAVSLRELCLDAGGEILRAVCSRKTRNRIITRMLLQMGRLSRSDYASVGLPWPLDRTN